jgi:hypothetical protein
MQKTISLVLTIMLIGKFSFGQVSFTSSNLPILVISTENNQNIPDGPKVKATLGIIYNGLGQRNNRTDNYNHYNGYIGIELRGNSTQNFPKKPYNFETRTSTGSNLNVALLGMPVDNDWVLIASFIDHTFIRNPLASYMSQLTGRWAPRFRHVEVVINNEYQGIYILMEKIKEGKERLAIADLRPGEISGEDVTGGYIWEITGFNANLTKSRNLKYPKFVKAEPEQIAYITQYDDAFRDVMQSSNYMDKITGYNAWIDAGSFVDELIIQEAMRNSDAYGWSGYFHKDKNGPICAGPVWDFDQSAGNSNYPDDGIVEDWMFSHPGTNNTPFFWNKLFEDPSFSYKVRYRWENLRSGTFSNENLTLFIDSIAGLLSEAKNREFTKWPVLSTYLWRETSGYETRTTYQAHVDYMTDFLLQRWDWMDNELAGIENPNPSFLPTISGISANDILIYPNPAKHDLTFEIKSRDFASAVIQIYNPLGYEVKRSENIILYSGITKYTVPFKGDMEEGVYLYRILIDNVPAYSGRFIKSR